MKNSAKRLFILVLFCILPLAMGCGSGKNTQENISIKVKRYNNKNGLPNNNITSVAAFAGQIWAGSENGLFRFDGVNWRIHVPQNTNVMASAKIEKLKVEDNALWISTYNGACKYDGRNWSSVYTGGRARAACGKNGQIAVGTAHGVEYSNGGSFSPLGKDAGLVYNEVSEIAFDTQGKLWVGTRSGMALLTSGVFQNYTGPAKTIMGTSLIDVPAKPANCKLIGNNIKTIISYKNMLAIGTTSGLSITDMQNIWKNYFAEHKEWIQVNRKIIQNKVSGNCPMPGNVVKALAKTQGDELLFVGTDKGLAILKDNTWVDYSKIIKHLPKLNINGLAVLNDDLWIGTSNGLYKLEGIDKLYKDKKN